MTSHKIAFGFAWTEQIDGLEIRGGETPTAALMRQDPKRLDEIRAKYGQSAELFSLGENQYGIGLVRRIVTNYEIGMDELLGDRQ